MNALKDRIATLQVGEPISAGDLAVFPLLGTPQPGPDYLTLDEAVAQNAVVISEVDASGVVGEVIARNLAATLVLIVEGEQLVGAKQNRTLNTSVLLGAGQAVNIPVSCTESGRWHYVSRGFGPSRNYSHPEMRRQKSRSVNRSLRVRMGFRSDQHAVWQEVDRVATRLGAVSPTCDYEGVHEAVGRLQETRSGRLEEIRLPEDALGVVVTCRGRIEAADLFDRPRTLQLLWPKLARGYALCALDRTSGKEPGELSTSTVAHFLESAASTASEKYPSPGVGETVRIDGPGITGACLTVGDHLVHASVFGMSER
ncbi:MAG: hypothetical protein HPY44_20030 [Armatimonadetes bacterium]|nr:hypothetical protein [Armatimonadota bacterium]